MRSAVSVACAVVLLTACAGQEQSPLHAAGARKPSPARSTPPKCDADSYAWQSVVHRTVLVGLSDTEEIEIPPHGSVRPPEPRLIRPMSARISAAAVEAGARPADVLASLEDKISVSVEPIGTHLTLSGTGTRVTSRMNNEKDSPLRGRFVAAVGVTLETAEFTAVCAGGTVRGTVTTWDKGRTHESLQCGLKQRLDEFAQEVERRACTKQKP